MMDSKLGAKRELRALPEHLWEGETVERLSSGTYGNGVGIVVVTDRRMLFLKDGRMSKTSEDFPFDKISSIQWSTGMLVGTITVFVSGNKAEIKGVGKVDGKGIVDHVRNKVSNKQSVEQQDPLIAAPVAQAAPPEDILGTLKSLGELRDAGVVTPDEFEAKKAELLQRL